MDYSSMLRELLEFRDKREWQQFHNSKDLAIALSIEAAELNELFLWKTAEQSEQVDPSRIREELADILSYAFLLAEKHDLDPFEIVSEKIRLNDQKYPVDKSKGRSDKYTDL